MTEESESVVVVKAKPARKVFKAPVKINKIPQDILHDPLIKDAIAQLPSNYNFEIHKSIWRLRDAKAKRVALQMPEGLLMFATTIADILEEFTGAEPIILADVTYGACCIDDYVARALEADFLIHYGHSCLIPIDHTIGINIQYVFVNINIDVLHCVECLKYNLPVTTKIVLVSTIQFAGTLQVIASEMKKSGYEVIVPQSKPLSRGEILGCTAPHLDCGDVIVYVGDGRFHLEAIMIANPKLRAIRYDPYEKRITEEYYEHEEMRSIRNSMIERAVNAGTFGLILGTLGRQGNPTVLKTLENRVKSVGKNSVVILLSEIFPDKIKLFKGIDAFIQVACPRLSIDWGTAFDKPFLTPYEGAVALKMIEEEKDKPYPMDFYAYASLGPWTPNHRPLELEKQTDTCCGKCRKEEKK